MNTARGTLPKILPTPGNAFCPLVADVADVATTRGDGAGASNDAFEERAAILEHDAGLSREEAEAQAALDYPDIPAFFDRRIR